MDREIDCQRAIKRLTTHSHHRSKESLLSALGSTGFGARGEVATGLAEFFGAKGLGRIRLHRHQCSPARATFASPDKRTRPFRPGPRTAHPWAVAAKAPPRSSPASRAPNPCHCATTAIGIGGVECKTCSKCRGSLRSPGGPPQVCSTTTGAPIGTRS